AYNQGFQFVPFLYRRLTEAYCPNRHDRFWRRCRCPKWIRGVLRDREIRKSAQTRSWERAEETARGMEERAAARDRKAEHRVTIKDAVRIGKQSLEWQPIDFREEPTSPLKCQPRSGAGKRCLCRI